VQGMKEEMMKGKKIYDELEVRDVQDDGLCV
jgi:hypothetical protein